MPLTIGFATWNTPTTESQLQESHGSTTQWQAKGISMLDAPQNLPQILPQKHTIKKKSLKHKIVVDGSTLTTDELKLDLTRFAKTVRSVEKDGHRIGVVILDLGTNASVSYGADEVFYPASSVKAPFVISVYEDLVDSGRITRAEVSQLAEPTIVRSDNEAYRALHRLCGNKDFADWAVSTGAIEKDSKDYQQFSTVNYPDMSARQLSLMWEQCFDYLSHGGESAEELLGLFERVEVSPIRAGLTNDELTITKAGWYPSDDGERYEATTDAGIVFEDGHAYVFVMMTDIADDLALLSELVPGIWSATSVLN